MIINQAISVANNQNPRYTRPAIPDSEGSVSMPGVQAGGGLPEAPDHLDLSSRNATVRENLKASRSQPPAADVAAGLLRELKEQIGEQSGRALNAQAGNLGAGLLKLLED